MHMFYVEDIAIHNGTTPRTTMTASTTIVALSTTASYASWVE
jgi:hypothetical protein